MLNERKHAKKRGIEMLENEISQIVISIPLLIIFAWSVIFGEDEDPGV